MRIAIATRDDDYSKELASILEEKCSEAGIEYDEENPNLIICIGGDGTILRAIHKFMLLLDTVDFVGIHTGTLGFLTDYTKDELDQFVQDLKRGPVKVDKKALLEVQVSNQEEPIYALNEVRIESVTRTLSLDVYIDDEFFEKATGSGLCICTQAGSTAVNRALGGAVIDSGLNVFELSEIMPITHKGHHSLGNPYIMNCDRTIQIVGNSLSDAIIAYDHLNLPLSNAFWIVITEAEKKVRFARFRTYSYFKRLKSLY